MIRRAGRIATATLCWLTAAYAFLSASAFTYHEIIRPRMFGVGVMLAVNPLLSRLGPDGWSVAVGILALAPIVLWSAIDHRAARDVFDIQPTIDAETRLRMEGRWMTAAAGSAILVAIVTGALTPVMMRGAFEPDLLTMGLSAGLIANLVNHAAIFCAAFLVVALNDRLFGWTSWKVRYAATALLFTVAISLIVQRLVCNALGFDGWTGAAVAGACGLTIVSSWAAARLNASPSPMSAVDIFLGSPASRKPDRRSVFELALIALAFWAVAAASRALDWDFLLLKSGVLVLWLVTVDRILRITPLVRVPDRWLACACVAPLAAYAAGGVAEVRAATIAGDPQFSARRVLDRYMVYNPAFRVAEGALTCSLDARQAGQAALLRFLRANTGLGDVNVAPPSFDFVAPMAPAARPPNIFLFVVDSLRPDYLSPYNRAVGFTPRLGEFASESLVFRNAFTQYGGTGLSLPAIWMGAAGLHKQYLKPFFPMNTLEKLLNGNAYRRVMSVDIIMEQLLRPLEPPIELDKGVRTMDYRFCSTLDEFQSALQPGEDDTRPVFGYSLPQDLHVSNIMTASVPPGETYPGFHAPYAARVHAIDGCFGRFIDFLKRRGLYDRSIVIVTADHGEMLGEEGRWGHVYYLFPPILHVPLLVHLPPDVDRTHVDLDAISFLTDISPTLYAALGYRPRSKTLMGRPLLGPDRLDGNERRRGDYVIAASYSAVYGVVRRNGRRVYIVDAMKGEEYAYARNAAGVWRHQPVSDGERISSQRLIREHVDEVRRVYHLPR